MIEKYIKITPKTEIDERISKLQNEMQKAKIEGALIIQKIDLFYFTGTAQDAYLYVPANSEPILMVKRSFERAKLESGIKNTVVLKSLKDIFTTILSITKAGSIGLETDVLPANLYLKYQKSLLPLTICDISPIVRNIRMIKSNYEIDALKESANVTLAFFKEIPKILKEGMTELELAGMVESIARKNGHQGFARFRKFNQELFYGHILSGVSASFPSFFDGPTGGFGANASFPQGASFKKIQKNETVVVDYTGILNGYIVDHTRIFSIGKVSEKLEKAHSVALEIKKEIIKQAKPKTNGKDLYDLACKIAKESGFENNFMGASGNQVSFIAHGVGLEVDELPVFAKNFDIILEKNMVIALEPKFIFPNEGTVGVEDTLYVDDDGLKCITSYNDTINII